MNLKTTFKKQFLSVILLFGITISNAQANLPYTTDFESNNGGWTSGGGDSSYGSYTSSPQGNKSWEIKDNRGDDSSFYQDFNLSGYVSVTISFSYQSEGFDNDRDRFEVKLDGVRVLIYKHDDDWENNGTKYTATITLSSSDYTFKSDSEIKFESDSGNWDKLYIDEISITGIKPIPCSTDAVTLPWQEGFETSITNEYTSNSSNLAGLCGWEYIKTNNGRLRFDEAKHTGSKAALFDTNSNNSSENSLIKTLNLSNYASATDLELSFWFADYGDENNTNDAVWIRGNNTDSWIKVYTINPESTTDGTWNHVTGLDIDQLLNDAGQTVSSTFQIKLSQYDNYLADTSGSFFSDGIAYDDIEITGTQYAIWRHNAWVNNVEPNINIKTLIDHNYNTGAEGSFSCKELIINANKILIVDNNTYVEVEDDVVVNGHIIIQTQGAFVQNNDSGNITGTGLMTVNKETAAANNWYEYTYWGSPVSGETIGNGLFEANANRRFKFIAQNFLDAKKEVGNNNAKLDGQDDIDDDGNDWAWLSAGTAMVPGVGYASTHNQSIFYSTPGYPKRIIYTFEGTFNNGVITVPVHRNDSELNDFNWNFIGNPYPSAIDADLFLAANSNISTDVTSTKSLNGAIFLWSQNTAPSNTANGNQQLNFSNDDYAIINASGQVAGGDGIKPTRNIPSGQGFFVAMDNDAPTTSSSGSIFSSSVIFNNSMRVKTPGTNSQFFKDSNVKKTSNTEANKLWINLTSDNGVFNQILVGYINGATNDDDGVSYDANKSATKGAVLYTTIDGSNQKFAIQGKDVNSINPDEIINLGFSTTINTATLYKLSIDDFQGDFLSSNTIYLKDNILNRLHNLSASDYTFTSEVGEFNNRFEIVFKPTGVLSTDDMALNNNVISIVELEDDQVQFSASNNLKIQSVGVFDILGKQLYQFKGQNSTETYRLSNLSNTVYIAKVALSNGVVITKKAVKK